MRDLIKQEQFEIEVLDKLNSGKFLSHLIFGGGTMLRLCHGLDRFSIDLDFWLLGKNAPHTLPGDIKDYLAKYYTIKDATDKFYTILLELKAAHYPRSLKIEVRKKTGKFRTEQAIAYSRYSTLQVMVKTVSLPDMMASKVNAFLDRREIRDVYDLEFFIKRGMTLNLSKGQKAEMLQQIDSLSKRDYAVKLGMLLEEGQRLYYRNENFKILKAALRSN
ncbi:MAG: nucleotidyl transferase AbiEii/AbiGii toxin family protein [Syntrophales bacterium]